MLIIALRRGGCGGWQWAQHFFRPCWENSTQHLIFVQHTEWGCRCQFHRHWHKADRWMEAVTMDRFFFNNALSTKSPLLFVLCTTHTWKSTEMQPRLKISWIYEMLESGFKHVTMNHDSQPWLNFPIFGLNSSTQPPNHLTIHPFIHPSQQALEQLIGLISPQHWCQTLSPEPKRFMSVLCVSSNNNKLQAAPKY